MNSRPEFRLWITLACCLAVGGCAAQTAGEFPSLAKRPQESAPPRTDDAPVEAPIPADAALIAQLRDLNGKIAIGETAFRASLPRAQSALAAAQGEAVASEPWVLAAMQLAALEFDRSPSQEALADLDRLLVDRTTAAQSTAPQNSGQNAGAAELIDSWTRANATVTEQTRLIEALKSQLGPA